MTSKKRSSKRTVAVTLDENLLNLFRKKHPNSNLSGTLNGFLKNFLYILPEYSDEELLRLEKEIENKKAGIVNAKAELGELERIKDELFQKKKDEATKEREERHKQELEKITCVICKKPTEARTRIYEQGFCFDLNCRVSPEAKEFLKKNEIVRNKRK